MHRPSIVIVAPSLTSATHGNEQTASRWARILKPDARVHVTERWRAGSEDLMIALHARRSADSVAAWTTTAAPRRPLLLVLTGTDLYRDIDNDASAQASLAAADALVVLNELGIRRLPATLQGRCHIVLQSCSRRRPVPKPTHHLRALMVGHLRDEKDPQTAFRAMRRLADRDDILLDHIGAALVPSLGARAAALAAELPGYRWLGALPHGTVRRRIQAAHVLVHPSRMEGGAHVVIEALRSATPVLASRVDGNLGILGAGWAGCFEPGDDAALAALLRRARDDAAMLPALQAQAAAREALFAPEAERAALTRLVAGLLGHRARP